MTTDLRRLQTLEGDAAGAELPHEDAEAIDVHLLRQVPSVALEELGRHVLDSAHRRRADGALASVQDPGQSEVAQFGRVAFQTISLQQQDVVGRQVAVDDASAMKVVRSRSYLCAYLHNFAEAALQQDLLRIYLLPEGPKPTPFLDDPELVAVRRARTTSNVPDTVQEGLHEVRVRQARGQLALEGHALGELLVEVLDDLHGHRRNVPPRAVHPTEGATTDYDNQIDVLKGVGGGAKLLKLSMLWVQTFAAEA
eukprot:CAMPEP_0177531132 /NCGR_PEP_ID=MMETSP0369-20130122/53833_1 /TAXON_ID=447022 ORGANISM="Scrippsiella hangoei-like, Strain SHHI-4" /NCGR_SAMPLE_ID=MMETSP0369 /ASSEMBLY_ACC=CAM_ASM_000364 /LENGTH=252 /DNA_ID=CAMNT_0019012161 /DNA_START=174 /DNA_END=928 /DNA_ORIENTATION=+